MPRRLSARFALFGALFILTASAGLVAQSATPDQPTPLLTPLMQMLKLVPNSPDYPLTTVGYSDLRAADRARPSAAGIKNWQAFETLSTSDDPKAALWINTIPPTGFSDMVNYVRTAGPQMQEVMGFDFFSIDRAITFGEPPAQGTILEGTFDVDQLDTALTSQGFVRDSIEGTDFPRWCSADGCEAGYQTDLAGRNIANLFGGELGRKQPEVLVDSRYLYSAPAFGVVQAVTGAYTGEVRSLAENPYFRAADAALSANADVVLRQAYFVNPLEVGSFPISPDLLTAPEGQATLDALKAGLGSLPHYGLLVFADLADVADSSGEGEPGSQYAAVVLVYGTEKDAQTALEVIPARMEIATSFLMRQTIKSIFDSREMTLLPPAVVAGPDTDPTSRRYAAIFVFRYPAPPEPGDTVDHSLTQIVQTGLGYRLLLDFLFRRDTLWLESDIAIP